MDGERLDLLAAALRADASDTRALIEVVASKFEGAFPKDTVIERKTPRLFSGNKRVERVTITFGQVAYTLSMAGERANATRSKTVGGITLRTEDLPVDQWLRALTEALAAEANRSEVARIALEQLLG